MQFNLKLTFDINEYHRTSRTCVCADKMWLFYTGARLTRNNSTKYLALRQWTPFKNKSLYYLLCMCKTINLLFTIFTPMKRNIYWFFFLFFYIYFLKNYCVGNRPINVTTVVRMEMVLGVLHFVSLEIRKFVVISGRNSNDRFVLVIQCSFLVETARWQNDICNCLPIVCWQWRCCDMY